MNRPYYDQIGIEPAYNTEDVLEQVYDDRNIDKAEPGMDWETVESELK